MRHSPPWLAVDQSQGFMRYLTYSYNSDTFFALKCMILHMVSFKTFMVSLYPAYRKFPLSYQYSHYHFVTWKFVRNDFTYFPRKAIQMENNLVPDHPLWPPQKPTHSEMTSCEQLHFNYYQLTSFLLWFSCFVVGGVVFLIKWNPLACQTFYKCLSILYEFFAFLWIKMLLWLKYKVFCENTISHKGHLSWLLLYHLLLIFINELLHQLFR